MAILEYMSSKHAMCDELFSMAESHAASEDWESAGSAFSKFLEAMEAHFGMEEEVLFPRFEEKTGNAGGPTQVMRMEHSQMRELFNNMGQSIQGKKRDDFLGESETLLMLMQQHNMKEEQILYPMTDQIFAGESDSLIASMEKIE